MQAYGQRPLLVRCMSANAVSAMAAACNACSTARTALLATMIMTRPHSIPVTPRDGTSEALPVGFTNMVIDSNAAST
jgi:hypothetical protein